MNTAACHQKITATILGLTGVETLGSLGASIKYDSYHCCLPSSQTGQCYKDGYGHGVCPEGLKFSKSKPCNESGKCYNQYTEEVNKTSISDRSRYHCSNAQCLPAESLCGGYTLCEDKLDLEACSPKLKCVYSKYGYNVKTLNTTLVQGHSYCSYGTDHNNGRYDTITREDEEDLDIFSISTATLDYTNITKCTTKSGRPGVRCGKKCIWNYGWCKRRTADECEDEGQSFTTRNPKLCGNTTFWNEISCNLYSDGEISAFGLRCTGKLQHCYYPWYVTSNKYYETYKAIHKHTCDDLSDRIFDVNSKCTTEKYQDKYRKLFCSNDPMMITSDNICDNDEAWINTKTTAEYLDPHDCYSSCKSPGPGCEACTNGTYLQCTRDGTKVCLHPELLCDGHAQCDQAEDENLDSCYDKYLSRRIIEKYATHICNSVMYPKMKTVATVCNEVVECLDQSDEDCDHSKFSNILLAATTVGIVLLYLSLKLSRMTRTKMKKGNTALPWHKFNVRRGP